MESIVDWRLHEKIALVRIKILCIKAYAANGRRGRRVLGRRSLGRRPSPHLIDLKK